MFTFFIILSFLIFIHNLYYPLYVFLSIHIIYIYFIIVTIVNLYALQEPISFEYEPILI